MGSEEEAEALQSEELFFQKPQVQRRRRSSYGLISVGAALLDVDNYKEKDPESSSVSSTQHMWLKRSLEKDPDQRSPSDIQQIFKLLNTIPSEFISGLEEPVKKAVCQKLILQEFTAGQRIFDYGDPGDRLFILWEGRVLLEVPRTSFTEESATPFAPLRTVEPGEVFGELAIMSEEKTRHARGTATKKSYLLALTLHDFKWCAGFEPSRFMQERVDFLRSAEKHVFENIPEVELKALAVCMKEEHFLGRQQILTQGRDVDRVIFVKSGFCKVVRKLHSRFRAGLCAHSDQGERSAANPFAPSAEELIAARSDGAPYVMKGRNELRKLLEVYNVPEVFSEDEDASPSSPHRSIFLGEFHSAPAPSPRSRSKTVVETPMNELTALDSVVVNVLHQGRCYGVMEMLEGLPYQCTVLPDPWAHVYIVSKWDLMRNTSKSILHRLFCDYKLPVSDDRLVHRLEQKRRWNNYKRGLLDEIQNRKQCGRNTTNKTFDREQPMRSSIGTILTPEDVARVGAGDPLWDERAQTPPRRGAGKGQSKETLSKVTPILEIKSARTEDGRPDVVIRYEEREFSLAALDERLTASVSNARQRERRRRSQMMQLPGPEGSMALQDQTVEERCPSAPSPPKTPKTPKSAEGPTKEGLRLPVGGRSNSRPRKSGRTRKRSKPPPLKEAPSNEPVSAWIQELEERARLDAKRKSQGRRGQIKALETPLPPTPSNQRESATVVSARGSFSTPTASQLRSPTYGPLIGEAARKGSRFEEASSPRQVRLSARLSLSSQLSLKEAAESSTSVSFGFKLPSVQATASNPAPFSART